MERIGSLRKIVYLFPESKGINIPDRQGSSAATRRMLSGFIACKSVLVVGVFLRRSNTKVLDDFSYQLEASLDKHVKSELAAAETSQEGRLVGGRK